MWFNFGRVIGEYPHLNKIKIEDKSILDSKLEIHIMKFIA